MKRIALYGGSFNPPALHHREIVRELSKHFDEIIVIPCGPRPDKPTTNDVDPVFRAAMVDLAFQDIPRARVELFDLECATFTRTHELEQRFSAEGEIWHVVGTDLVRGGGEGKSAIQTGWKEGRRLWQHSRFVVMTREGYQIKVDDLPPLHQLIQAPLSGSSKDVRNLLFNHEPAEKLLPPAVSEYIARRNLYRGGAPVIRSVSRFADENFLISADDYNPEAKKLAAQFRSSPGAHPSLHLVLGGDGTMLRAIRANWRNRVPFYGLNFGHLGFLLNERSRLPKPGQDYIYQHLPLLYVEVEAADGSIHSGYAFNDTWVERVTGQAAWIEVRIDGEVRLEKLVSDGALVSTASGCSSYAHAMGAPIVPFDTPVLILVGSNVFRPIDWRSAALGLDSRIELRTLEPKKRPLRAFVDGEPLGEVRAVRVRLSRIASAELVFQPEMSTFRKTTLLQFPAAAGA